MCTATPNGHQSSSSIWRLARGVCLGTCKVGQYTISAHKQCRGHVPLERQHTTEHSRSTSRWLFARGAPRLHAALMLVGSPPGMRMPTTLATGSDAVDCAAAELAGPAAEPAHVGWSGTATTGATPPNDGAAPPAKGGAAAAAAAYAAAADCCCDQAGAAMGHCG